MISINDNIMNKKDIAEFITHSIITLLSSDYTCCKYDIDDDYAIFIGWSIGFDSDDNDIYHDSKNPNYAICYGVKKRNDCFWTDFDDLDVPYDKDTGDLLINDYVAYKEEDYEHISQFLIDDYNVVKGVK